MQNVNGLSHWNDWHRSSRSPESIPSESSQLASNVIWARCTKQENSSRWYRWRNFRRWRHVQRRWHCFAKQSTLIQVCSYSHNWHVAHSSVFKIASVVGSSNGKCFNKISFTLVTRLNSLTLRSSFRDKDKAKFKDIQTTRFQVSLWQQSNIWTISAKVNIAFHLKRPTEMTTPTRTEKIATIYWMISIRIAVEAFCKFDFSLTFFINS